MKGSVGSIVIGLSLLISVNLFILAKVDGGGVSWSFVSVSQILSLIGTTLLSISFVLSSRMKWVEEWFGGLDRVYKAHHITGGVAFVALLHHPIFLAVNALPRADLGIRYLWFGRDWSYNFGLASLYLLILLLILTLLVRLPYSLWKKTHEWMGVVLLFACLHVLTIQSDVSRYLPLRYWMIVVLATAGWSVIYRRFLYRVMGPRFKYVVDRVDRRGDVVTVWLRPMVKEMKYRAGQFLFTTFEGFGAEAHPFSIASGSNQKIIKLGIKISGDYTLELRRLAPGVTATLWGPYGGFATRAGTNDWVWVAGGIGITPFLGMLDDEVLSDSGRKVDLFYCVSEEAEAVFDQEIGEKVPGNSRIKYRKFLSCLQGRITARVILDTVGSFVNKRIMLCGPGPMMESLAGQLRKLGVSRRNIMFEDFDFK